MILSEKKLAELYAIAYPIFKHIHTLSQSCIQVIWKDTHETVKNEYMDLEEKKDRKKLLTFFIYPCTSSMRMYIH